jgi:hypothetical protein
VLEIEHSNPNFIVILKIIEPTRTILGVTICKTACPPHRSDDLARFFGHINSKLGIGSWSVDPKIGSFYFVRSTSIGAAAPSDAQMECLISDGTNLGQALLPAICAVVRDNAKPEETANKCFTPSDEPDKAPMLREQSLTDPEHRTIH